MMVVIQHWLLIFYQPTHKAVTPIDDLANVKPIGETFTRLIFSFFNTALMLVPRPQSVPAEIGGKNTDKSKFINP